MYKRVLLKLSGEALKGGNQKQIFDVECVKGLASVMATLHQQGVGVCVVIGAGNIWRGKLASELDIEPVHADFMGMMGTVINAVALANNLKSNHKIPTTVYSAIPEISGVTVAYNQEKANQDLENGKVVFLSGGTGKPFFTTDTAAAMRAIELHCDAILMGKNGVKGVYDKDPQKYPDAKFIEKLTFNEMLQMNLQIMDSSAVELLQGTNIDVRIFSMAEPENFLKVINGENIGTTMKGKF